MGLWASVIIQVRRCNPSPLLNRLKNLNLIKMKRNGWYLYSWGMGNFILLELLPLMKYTNFNSF